MAVQPKSLVLRTSDGRRLSVRLSEKARTVKVRRGDCLVLETSGTGEALSLKPAEAGQRVAGRVRSLSPGRKELTVETSAGAVKVRVLAGTVLFKENQPGNWLELHQGDSVAAQVRNEGALTLFDALSYVIREFEPIHGGLLAQGTVSAVTPTSPTDGTLTLGQTTLRYDRQTRWQLGARFTRPQDFEGVESLIFGPPGQARMILSRRAVPFVFETLVSSPDARAH